MVPLFSLLKLPWLIFQPILKGVEEKDMAEKGLFLGENPAYGATIRYYVKEVPEGPKAKREKEEKKSKENKTDINYPSNDELLVEDNYEAAYFVFVVKNAGW